MEQINILALIFGKTLEEAEKIAQDKGYHIRVTCKDGKYYIVTRDYRLDRVNVHLENNIVTKTDIG